MDACVGVTREHCRGGGAVWEARAVGWGWRAQKWEAHLREERGGQAAGGPGAAQAAWARWAGVSRKARLVLKRASPELVAVLGAALPALPAGGA